MQIMSQNPMAAYGVAMQNGGGGAMQNQTMLQRQPPDQSGNPYAPREGS